MSHDWDHERTGDHDHGEPFLKDREHSHYVHEFLGDTLRGYIIYDTPLWRALNALEAE